MDIKQILKGYLKSFPEEEKRLFQFSDFINTSQNDIKSRSNFVGHITASGIVLSTCKTKVLLLYHQKLCKYLQPGGHMEPEDTTALGASIREIIEETSLANLQQISYHFDENIPIDIDTHKIPYSAKDSSPDHFHHDFRFLFISNDKNEIVSINNTESASYQWVPLNDLLEMRMWEKLIPKIRHAIGGSYKSTSFYQSIVRNYSPKRKISVIAVIHFIPDVISYVDALVEWSSELVLIPKPKSINDCIKKQISEKCRIEEISRNEIIYTDRLSDICRTLENPFVLIDIGGYFSSCCDSIKSEFGEKFLGIVEDTENGFQKYQSTQIRCDVPIVSVARSPLKDNEDYLIGQSVLFSADALLRQRGELIQYMKCSIFGFGKIGRSIAFNLSCRAVKPHVFDLDAIQRLSAFNQQFSTPARQWMLENSDVIFCATGGKVFDIFDFRLLKNGSCIFSVTSSDDEFDLRFLSSEYDNEVLHDGFVKYFNDNNCFYLANAGNAVNFIHNAVVGDFIHCVRAEIIASAHKISNGNYLSGLQSNDTDFQRGIAEHWIAKFVDI